MKKQMLKIITITSLFGFISCTAQVQTQQNVNEPKKETSDNKKVVYDSLVPAPTLQHVSYGAHSRNVLDFWRAPSNKPTPVVIFIHGGGWNGGSKEQLGDFVNVRALLDAGISVAAISYRFIKNSKDLDPYVKGPMSDGARAVQFVRSMSSEWNIDKTRIAATGGSAGACTSLWLAYHDDIADPNSLDKVARESSRLSCVAAVRVQSTLDPKQMKEWIPNSKYGAHAFGLDSFDQFLAARDSLLPVINEYSPYALLTNDDPDTYLFYPIVPQLGKNEKDPTHSAVFGVKLQERCNQIGVSCELVYPGAPNVRHETATDYLIDRLLK
ncbi:alpha/beta hydrolase [Flavobacterium algicola]|uniref:alpha/beta hydrolase n=1 Tax=Flavobacterium algicola TaxID=556529 RepID=UPI001EFED277|nr:alpha/beta hydrolase [Flavobacterium algicola]MCG9792840.1 alpha/beta hydrolase [Flavobacterium algicola]